MHPRCILLPVLLTVLAPGCSDPGGPTAPPATPGFAHTPPPVSVTLAGSFQSEVGCPGDWQPECPASSLALEASDGIYQGSFSIPAGSWEYKVALNGAWDENYGAHAIPNGPNIPMTLDGTSTVKFYYDHATHWITSNRNAEIAVAVGSFQSELGCPGDWQPDCLRSWLQDPDGDGVYHFTTGAIPAGAYEAKVAIAEGWDENYGAGGAPNGSNIPFVVPAGAGPLTFTYVAATHSLTITPQAVSIPESFAAAAATVESLIVSDGIERSMLAKLAAALAYWEAGETANACSSLQALRNEISALRGKRQLPDADASQLDDAIAGLRSAIGC